ncbi:MAG: GTPase [Phycisphaerae bacterium]|jgi:tRNA modification GTPase
MLKKNRNLKDRSFTFAALMTARTAAAISSIQVAGGGAEEVLKIIFKPAGKNNSGFSAGKILYGTITDSQRIVDEVVIGCEGENNFSINCHGNPLIVENILALLQKHNAQIVEPNEMMIFIGREKFGDNAIAIEAEIAGAEAATLDGAKIIAEQVKAGLYDLANNWLKTPDIEDIKKQAKQVLADSKIANYFINGAKIVIAGAPNSGKSTLFNYLCGREKAIVSDIAGTTRDWLNAKIKLKKIVAEFFDTAGVDENLITKNTIDAQSQALSRGLIENADLVLLVVDGVNPAIVMAGLTDSLEKLVVYNKCDLAGDVSNEGLNISAKTGRGVRELIAAIEQKLGVAEFDVKKTVCFTDRQKNILEQVVFADTKQRIDELITELLKGEL